MSHSPQTAYADFIDETVARITDSRGTARRLWLPITDHETRADTLATLAARLGDAAVAVDLLDADEVDAPICGLLEAAARLDDPTTRSALARDWPSLTDAAGLLGETLHQRRQALLVHAPRSWWSSSGDPTADTHSGLGRRLTTRRTELLRTLARLPVVVIWLTDRGVHPVELGLRRDRDAICRLPASHDATEAPTWARPAAWLAWLLEAMGRRPDPALADQPRARQINTLTRSLTDALRCDQHIPHHRALSQWARLRRPTPITAVLDLIDWPEAWAHTLREHTAPDDAIRPDPWVLRRVTDPLAPAAPADLEVFHARAAQYYAGLDGAASFEQTRGPEGIWWLEKLHHLAHGGERTHDEWSQQTPACREHYWSRARHLSVVEHDHRAAARLYRACVDHYPDDDYAWHYLGYNLHHADGARCEIEAAYRAAVARDPANPWWNSGLVTFLIGEGRHRDARAAWDTAGHHLDGADRWVAENAHRWVARTWLMLDGLDDARAVLDEVPDAVIEHSEALRALRHDLCDALEYRRLGQHAVYPRATPHADRWRAPCRARPDDVITRWFPGQVLTRDDAGVTVVYAVPTDPPERRRAVIARFTPPQWAELTPGDLTYFPGDFIELLHFEDGRRRVRYVGRDATEPTRDEQTVHRALTAGHEAR